MELNWKNICFIFENHLAYYDVYLPIEDLFKEIIIPITSESSQIRGDVIDWWPRSSVNYRIERLKDFKPFLYEMWKTNKGTLHTANLLWNYKDKKDEFIYVWLRAYLTELTESKYLRAILNHEQFKIIYELNDFMISIPEYEGSWHHLMTKLTQISPEMIVDIKHILGNLNSNNTIIKLAAQHFVLVQGAYQLVQVKGESI